jgi:flagellar hook-associated protein 2
MGIKSLGIGSSNGLNMETIDKLRSADENAIVRPIDKSIGEYEQKIDSIGEFTKLLSTLRDDTKNIKDDFLYLQRTASVIGEGVSAVVEDGVEPQNINIKVDQLALEDIIQSDPFLSKSASIAPDDTRLIVKVGDDYEEEIDIKAGMQLRDFVSAINEQLKGVVNASILQTGESEFRLVLRTEETGSNQDIKLVQGTEAGTRPVTETVTISKELPLKTDPLTGAPLPQEYETEDIEVVEHVDVPAVKLNQNLYNEVQEAQNAQFTFNGADITRESNTIDDMVYGLEFTLEEVTEKNKRVNIKINQDTNQVLDNMQAFVMNYNALMTEVDNMTRYDADEDKVGLFLGENTINSVRSSINNILRQVGPNGESIANAGVTFSRDGQMEFDSFAFEKSLLDDPDSMQVLLQGKKETKNGKDLQEDGLFYKLYEVMDDLVNSADGSIINFEKSLETQLKRTKDEKKTAIKRLDNRYETMQNQFAAAGSAIGKLQNGFESVNMQIKQAQSSK